MSEQNITSNLTKMHTLGANMIDSLTAWAIAVSGGQRTSETECKLQMEK